MNLREDSDQYCLMWLGLALMGAYYFNFAFIIIIQPSYLPVLTGNFLLVLLLLMLPLVMVFFFTAYLRPTRGKAKSAALGPSLVSALFFVILTYLLSLGTDMLGNVVFFSGWGIGSSLLTAGGFSMLQTSEQSTSSGILDVASLRYGPPEDEPAQIANEDSHGGSDATETGAPQD